MVIKGKQQDCSSISEILAAKETLPLTMRHVSLSECQPTATIGLSFLQNSPLT
jgi:hypothetical protein